MAQHSPSLTGSIDPGLSFRRVKAHERRPALSLLLTGHISDDEPSVENFLQFAAKQQMSLTETWGAFRDNELRAACLLIEAAGRAGILFLSPSLGGATDLERAALINHALQDQDATKLHLVQALVDPMHQSDVQALEAASFQSLATLVYMQRTLRRADGGAKLTLKADEQHLKLSGWSSTTRPLFERAILGSYEQTLDCPGLLGMREIDDIIDGHMSSGEFAPDLWHVLHDGDEPVGVMLINRTPPNDAMELVYLGLTPAWRGRGLGARLLTWGIGKARDAGGAQMLLAVDEANAPAMAMYRALQFIATGHKIAMIRGLR